MVEPYDRYILVLGPSEGDDQKRQYDVCTTASRVGIVPEESDPSRILLEKIGRFGGCRWMRLPCIFNFLGASTWFSALEAPM